MQDSSSDSKDAALGDLVIPALAIAFTVYFFDSILDLAWEARATGMVVGIALLALIALLVVRIVRRMTAGRATLSFGDLLGPWPHGRQRIGIVLLCALFITLIPWLGLTLGLFTLMTALMLLLGAGNWRAIITTAGAVSISAYLLFVVLLNSRMPRGPIEKLAAMLF
jgi:hypothetical protein